MLTTVCFRDQIFTMNSTYKYAINKNIHLNEGKSVQFDIVVISAISDMKVNTLSQLM